MHAIADHPPAEMYAAGLETYMPGLWKYDYPFTAEEMQSAWEEWGCNCGPGSLAFALQIGLDKVRGKIPGFDEKRYTSPTMMKAGLAALGKTVTAFHARDGKPTEATMFSDRGIALTRVQWTGPWTAAGANPKWAYRQTHWVATWELMRETGHDGAMAIHRLVFDINGGIMVFDYWKNSLLPKLTASYKRADGGWFPTHVWRID